MKVVRQDLVTQEKEYVDLAELERIIDANVSEAQQSATLYAVQHDRALFRTAGARYWVED